MILLDGIALLFFFISWIGYVYYAKKQSKKVPSLQGVMPQYRRQWMENMVESHEARVFDASLLGNLMRVTTFFASTTVLLLFATAAGFGAITEISQALAQIAFAETQTLVTIMGKLLVLAVVFIYAFFKFTWALRQFSFVSVLLGAAANIKQQKDNKKTIYQLSALEGLAAGNFTNGLRAYYFSLAVLTWFLHPFVFMVVTVIIIMVLHRREFNSDTLAILEGSHD